MKLNLIILLAIVLTSCVDRRSKLKVEREALMERSAPPVTAASAADNRDDASTVMPDAQSKQLTLRKLIKNGMLSFETNDIDKTRREIESLYLASQGYLASENRFNYGERLQFDLEVRLPSENFDSFIQKLEQLGSKIENKHISTQDVTEEFIDVEARLKTKKDLEARYLELLKLANGVEEMLSIESQLSNVRSEIESMAGRINFLGNQVAFSTVKISYYEVTGVDFGFASKLVRSLKNGWDNLLGFLIAVINVWPFLILLTGGILVYVRYKKRLRGAGT